MAATVPQGYQNVGNGAWAKNIKIKGKTFQVVVNPTTEQKWLYEQDTYGNGKPLFTIDQNSPNGVARTRDVNGNLVPINQDEFSYSERASALNAAGINGQLLVNTLKQETTWANVQGTQPAPGTPAPGQPPGQTPGSATAGPGSGIGTTFDVGNYADNPLTNLLSEFDDPNNFDGIKQFLYYPSNIGASGQDKITITQISYVPGDPFKALTGSLGSRESDFNSPTVKTHGMVILPIPNELSETNQTGWGEDSLSTISAALMGKALPLVSDIASGRVGATLGNLRQAADTLGNPTITNRLKQFLTVNAAASVLKLGNINVNPEAYITRVTGTAINPNLELLFNGPKLRQFGFQFKLTPRDEKEARNIRSIIKFFKKGMAPRRSNRETLSVFLGTPNVFRIKFTSGETGRELTSVGKIKTCALQSFSASYTPDGFYAAYRDAAAGGSQPISVVINLAFIELTPIFNDEYDGNSPSVGPEFVQEQAKAFVSVPQPGSPNFIGPVPGGQ